MQSFGLLLVADGRRIEDVITVGARGAIAAGPMAQMAFDVVGGGVVGRPSIDTSVLGALRERLPTGLARVFDTGVARAAATAQDRRNALKAALGALASKLPVVRNSSRSPTCLRLSLSRVYLETIFKRMD